MKKTKEKKDPAAKRRAILYNILLVISLVALLISGAFLLREYLERKQAENMSQNLEELTTQAPQETYPAEPADVLPQYREAYLQNSDLVGWITVPNTTINAPVLQGKDNAFYLRHDFHKEKLRRGSIFMDYRNAVDPLNNNTILYGHNYLDSTMFSDLEKFKDLEFYKTTPVIEFNTIRAAYKWKVFAVFLTTASPELDNNYVFNYIYPYMTQSSFAEFITEVEKRSYYKTDVDVLPTDKILTLSTCSRDLDLKAYKQEDVRCVVMARMVRAGEDETVDVAKAVLNPNPKYPQLYYDKYKKENPYINDEKWYPRGEVN